MKKTMGKKPGRTGRPTPARGGSGSGSGFPAGGADEGVRLCRSIATELGADGFAFLLAAPGANHSLKSVFDSDFPLCSPYLSAFLDIYDGELARHLLASSVPMWWHGPATDGTSYAALPWGAPLPNYGGLGAGVAFPCYAERGAKGMVLFWGRTLGPGTKAMFNAHARCFALFEAVSLLRAEGENGGTPMSRRELECLEMTAQGLTSAEIAKSLGMAANTVDQHLGAAMAKLNAVSRVHAVAKAMRFGLID